MWKPGSPLVVLQDHKQTGFGPFSLWLFLRLGPTVLNYHDSLLDAGDKKTFNS